MKINTERLAERLTDAADEPDTETPAVDTETPADGDVPAEGTEPTAPWRGWKSRAKAKWDGTSRMGKLTSAAAIAAVVGAAVYTPTAEHVSVYDGTKVPAPAPNTAQETPAAPSDADPFQAIMADAAAWIPPTLDTMPCDPEDMQGLYFFNSSSCRIDLTYGGNGNVTPDGAAEQTGHPVEETRDAYLHLVAGTAAGLAQAQRAVGEATWDTARPYSHQLSAVCLAGAYMAHAGIDEAVGAAVLQWEFSPVPDDGELLSAYLNMRLHAAAKGYLFEKNEGTGSAVAHCTHLLINANFE
ncbi:hypothetical protein BST28_17535 [Mycolicibacter kumamotonensis]|uniref:Uncharacterized protein n=1 Tax=Mycolicibacter kumamotonensis TaxID=354243 RepID=A0A1X0DZ73_9MYCO|nr:hypothetical protein [Mycolicibacter kumamotonensis]ORA77605.1 hypothetical protein BST28_17535 [Mycolicibacter kumamotonensis]